MFQTSMSVYLNLAWTVRRVLTESTTTYVHVRLASRESPAWLVSNQHYYLTYIFNPSQNPYIQPFLAIINNSLRQRIPLLTNSTRTIPKLIFPTLYVTPFHIERWVLSPCQYSVPPIVFIWTFSIHCTLTQSTILYTFLININNRMNHVNYITQKC